MGYEFMGVYQCIDCWVCYCLDFIDDFELCCWEDIYLGFFQGCVECYEDYYQGILFSIECI